jgi:hypothetical protein
MELSFEPRVLVASAVLAPLMAVAVAVLFAGSLQRLLALDPGFDRSGVLTFRTDPPFTRYGDIATTSEFYRRAIEALRALGSSTTALGWLVARQWMVPVAGGVVVGVVVGAGITNRLLAAIGGAGHVSLWPFALPGALTAAAALACLLLLFRMIRGARGMEALRAE